MKGGHAQDLVSMIFNYPTLAEGYRIAAFNGLNKIFPDGIIRPPGSPPPQGKKKKEKGQKDKSKKDDPDSK